MFDYTGGMKPETFKDMVNILCDNGEKEVKVIGDKYFANMTIRVSENVTLITSTIFTKDVTEEELINMGCLFPSEMAAEIKNRIESAKYD